MDTADSVLDTVRCGRSCTVEAVPGAGKTSLLLQMSELGPSCLILAYNAQLASDIAGRLTSKTATCLTFHSLCCGCIGMTRDDEQMLEWVESAEAGGVVVRPLAHVDLVLIDEAQDVRALYVRLIKVCGLGDSQICIVGDRNQLVYDFDESFPASLDVLLCPETMLDAGAGGFVRHTLQESHRLTRPMVGIVNAMFDENIASCRPGPRVSVRSPRSMFKLFDVLEDVVDRGDLLVIVDRKKGNRPLRAFLNECSQRGKAVSVHGVDERDGGAEGGAEGDVRCGTFWSTKGIEARTVVVILPRAASRNPTYVALTRASERLVVVVDPREPHAAFCSAVVGNMDDCSIHDEHTRKVVTRGSCECATTSLARMPRFARTSKLGVIVDHLRPGRQAVRDAIEVTHVSGCDDGDEPGPVVSLEVASIGVQVALIRCETSASGDEGGAVRCVNDILQPTRLDSEQVEGSICKGLLSRWIPRNVSEDNVLAADLRHLVRTSSRGETFADAVVLALGSLAWNEFDHIMRKHLPVDPRKFAVLLPNIEWIESAIDPTDFVWDTRLVVGNTHCRVHATCPEFCLHVVWESSTDDEAAAAVRASLHPNHECRLVDLGSQRIRSIVTQTRLYEL
tara:strand:+ start:4398 stop:6263 length:1866 start_codon:yes stop_codon:yes gene_type:complete